MITKMKNIKDLLQELREVENKLSKLQTDSALFEISLEKLPVKQRFTFDSATGI